MKKRQMKKWIPHDFAYCHGLRSSRNDHCKWWFDVTKNRLHLREECQFSKYCDDNCNQCNELITYCKYLGKIEYGQYPLGDMCKICGVHNHSKKAVKAWR